MANDYRDLVGSATTFLKQKLIEVAPGYHAPNVAATLTDAAGASIASLTVEGRVAVVVGTLTRPADTTPYAILDGMTTSTSAPAVVTVANAARVAEGSGLIVGARMAKNTTSLPASFRVHVYDGSPAGIPNDNAAFAEQWANRAIYVGYIDFASFRAGADCAISSGVMSRSLLAFKLTAGTSLYLIHQAMAAYTPASGEVFDTYFDISG